MRAETLGDANKTAANSRIGMGFIGMGLISDGHVRSFPGMKDVQLIAVCDVREEQLKKAAGVLNEKGFKDIAATSHFEEVLANSDIQAVCVTTPDHWDAAIVLAALKAGKDVYVEKPMALSERLPAFRHRPASRSWSQVGSSVSHIARRSDSVSGKGRRQASVRGIQSECS